MMNKLTDRSGMALIIVLTMSMFLLVIAVSYIRGNAQSRPINERHFERAQADFLGQGVVQLAAMKFKKRPAEFYYAYRAMRAGLGDAALRVYLNDDPTLNGEFVDQEGQRYEYFTQMQLITNKLYETDGIRIQVTVNQLSDTGAIVLSRAQEHVIEAKRRPL